MPKEERFSSKKSLNFVVKCEGKKAEVVGKASLLLAENAAHDVAQRMTLALTNKRKATGIGIDCRALVVRVESHICCFDTLC